MSNLIITPRVSEGGSALHCELERTYNNTVSRRRGDSPFTYGQRRFTKVINWGCGNLPVAMLGARAITSTNSVTYNINTNIATNKLLAFRAMRREGLPVPEYTTEAEVARQWTRTGRVYCRTALRGNSGTDIRIANTTSEIVNTAPLFTKEVIKRHEFRIHVVNGVVIDGVRKAFRSDVPEEERNRDIMNHAAGTVFVRGSRSLSELRNNPRILDICVRAVTAVGLDFGAVDLMQDMDGDYYILEINTAPGLEGTTLERYALAFDQLLNNRPITPWSEQTTQTESQTEGNTPMPTLLTANHIRSQLTTIVTPSENSSVSTLTPGTSYTVQSIRSGDRIVLRNDNGRLQTYMIGNNFYLVNNTTVNQPTTTAAPAAPEAPAAPTFEDGLINPEADRTSSLRGCVLSDGSFVNVGGTVSSLNTGDSLLERGIEYVVVEITRAASDHSSVYLGVNVGSVSSPTIRRYLRTRFDNGSAVPVLPETNSVATPPAPPAPPAVLLGSDQQPVVSGSTVIITSSNGGHGLRTGTQARVTNIDFESGMVTVISEAGRNRTTTSRVRASRLRTLSDQELSLLEESRGDRAVHTISLDGNTFRIRGNSVSEVTTLLRRLAL